MFVRASVFNSMARWMLYVGLHTRDLFNTCFNTNIETRKSFYESLVTSLKPIFMFCNMYSITIVQYYKW